MPLAGTPTAAGKTVKKDVSISPTSILRNYLLTVINTRENEKATNKNKVILYFEK